MGEQRRAGLGELHIGAALVPDEPAFGDRAIDACPDCRRFQERDARLAPTAAREQTFRDRRLCANNVKSEQVSGVRIKRFSCAARLEDTSRQVH